jgi:hypothetical protein
VERSIADQSEAELGGSGSVLARQRRDHQELDRLMARHRATTGDEQAEALNGITRLAFSHAFAEEAVLWPAIRRSVPDGDALTLRIEQEHQEINELTAALERTPPGERRDELTERLLDLLDTDVRDEEDVVLPRLQQAVSADELRALGRRWAAVRRIAPTRPHPVVSRRPPGNVLSALPLSLLDRSRDRLDKAARGADGPVAGASRGASRVLASVAGGGRADPLDAARGAVHHPSRSHGRGALRTPAGRRARRGRTVRAGRAVRRGGSPDHHVVGCHLDVHAARQQLVGPLVRRQAGLRRLVGRGGDEGAGEGDERTGDDRDRRLTARPQLDPGPLASPPSTQKPSSDGTAETTAARTSTGRPTSRANRSRAISPSGSPSTVTGPRPTAPWPGVGGAAGATAAAGTGACWRSSSPADCATSRLAATATAAAPVALLRAGCRRTADAARSATSRRATTGSRAADARLRETSGSLSVAHRSQLARWRSAPSERWRRRSPADTATSTDLHARGSGAPGGATARTPRGASLERQPAARRSRPGWWRHPRPAPGGDVVDLVGDQHLRRGPRRSTWSLAVIEAALVCCSHRSSPGPAAVTQVDSTQKRTDVGGAA